MKRATVRVIKEREKEMFINLETDINNINFIEFMEEQEKFNVKKKEQNESDRTWCKWRLEYFFINSYYIPPHLLLIFKQCKYNAFLLALLH